MEFHKLHGTGNDFIVVNNWHRHFSEWQPDYIRRICARHTGIGADGFLAIEKSKRADFRMRFFNSDGIEAEMCVNGSRCIGYLAHRLNIVGTEFSFEAGDGIHHARITGPDRVQIQVLWHKEPDSRTFPVDFVLPDGVYFRKFLNTGVPHLVLECEDIGNVTVEQTGSALRFHSYYQPEGTNVNFVAPEPASPNTVLNLRTYERGVDAETLACGTGATASALSYFSEPPPKDINITVNTRGGKLVVSILKNFADIYLQGPVAYIYKGIYSEEGNL
jgi:diaminopimelate epimerase